jgi:hypothetical protein
MLTLEQMTPEQKLGRVLCFRGMHNPDNIEFALEMLEKNACGPLNVGTYATNLRPDLIKTLRKAADYPVLIVEDMELGYPKSKLPKNTRLSEGDLITVVSNEKILPDITWFKHVNTSRAKHTLVKYFQKLGY